MDPEIFAVGGLNDGLVEIRVGDDPVEPAVENLLVGMDFAITPLDVLGDRDVDVCCFIQGVLAGVCATDIYIQGIAAVATGDDDGLLCELTERLQDSFAELFFKDRDEL